ncbi:unnamed protein product [Tilletia controversa]|uniref:NAD(P)-binding protein n=3 Tax=Tilletia TaxID=13289 RepID=A0A8X7MMD3_9BASI|nr:hypothetical protein CF336_g6694 [Tilletia laevis]KAE8193129.1 hypothetical protein CF328_g5140 [Tilletia controversa]KAE8261550.1 hypothetical protein A4X03_0g3158 [Tilletia caries]KAE8191795.1 hypothetical protein CF335_g5994 [Tilletia laevis]KAE8242190.1 hypothetical protein A4X06_0g7147 [Tilletia controversa]
MPAQPKFVGTLKGTKVLLIGGSSGIGFGVAQHLIEEGASVAIASSSQSKVTDAVSRLNDGEKQYNADSGRVSGHTVDLAGQGAEESLKKLFEEVGKVDHLVYTAGILNPRPLKDQTYEHIVATGDVRFTSAILAVKTAVHGGYLKEGGSIVLTTGSAYQYPTPDWAVLGAYCGAFISLTRAFALEFSSRNIRVNCVSPGPIKTELWAGIPPAVEEQLAAGVLTGKVGRVEDVALTYVALIKNRNINGETVNDDGGGFHGKL